MEFHFQSGAFIDRGVRRDPARVSPIGSSVLRGWAASEEDGTGDEGTQG